MFIVFLGRFSVSAVFCVILSEPLGVEFMLSLILILIMILIHFVKSSSV